MPRCGCTPNSTVRTRDSVDAQPGRGRNGHGGDGGGDPAGPLDGPRAPAGDDGRAHHGQHGEQGGGAERAEGLRDLLRDREHADHGGDGQQHQQEHADHRPDDDQRRADRGPPAFGVEHASGSAAVAAGPAHGAVADDAGADEVRARVHHQDGDRSVAQDHDDGAAHDEQHPLGHQQRHLGTDQSDRSKGGEADLGPTAGHRDQHGGEHDRHGHAVLHERRQRHGDDGEHGAGAGPQREGAQEVGPQRRGVHGHVAHDRAGGPQVAQPTEHDDQHEPGAEHTEVVRTEGPRRHTGTSPDRGAAPPRARRPGSPACRPCPPPTRPVRRPAARS